MTCDSSGSILLVSGGLDSLLMMGEALGHGESVVPLYVCQGALWEDSERACLRQIFEALRSAHGARVGELIETRVEFPSNYDARWAVDPEAAVPDQNSKDDAVYLPGRNMALLLAGSMLARSRWVKTVRLGLLDTNPFADSTDQFVSHFEEMFEMATNWRVRIKKPLTGRSKPELLRAGAALPLALTSSCLRPAGRLHCGRCNKCAERRWAFAEAGLPDPTEYRV